MDYKSEYIVNLRKLINYLDINLQNRIINDVIKLRDVELPNLDEMKIYFDELELFDDVNMWKFIFKELTYIRHIKIRNESVIRLLKRMKQLNAKIKPFVLLCSTENSEKYSRYGLHATRIVSMQYMHRNILY